MKRLFIVLLVISVSGGCADHNAVRVRCDRHLTPINSPQKSVPFASSPP